MTETSGLIIRCDFLFTRSCGNKLYKIKAHEINLLENLNASTLIPERC